MGSTPIRGCAGKWRKLKNRGRQPLRSDFSFPIVFTIVYRINDFEYELNFLSLNYVLKNTGLRILVRFETEPRPRCIPFLSFSFTPKNFKFFGVIFKNPEVSYGCF